MRLAVYNVENLFDRAKAMNGEDWAQGRPVLDQFAELNGLLGEIRYDAAAKDRMAELMGELGLTRSDTGPYVILRRNKGGLVRRPRAGGLLITANGRADWSGSLELVDEPVNDHAMRNTARLINALDADILGLVEVESRPVLSAFNTELLPALGGLPYRHVMVIDGNDVRGIDVGIMARDGFPIGDMRSHVDDCSEDGASIFSRDCPEYMIETAGGRMLVMVNHFKSKGFGGFAQSSARRRMQAERVAEIYRERREQGHDLIAVIGDLNDTPDSNPLAPLLATDLADAFTHPDFDDGGYPGTHGSCRAADKIDYLMLSPALFERMRRGGVMRTGMWPGVRPKKWDVFEELTRPEEAASDHAALWVDLEPL